MLALQKVPDAPIGASPRTEQLSVALAGNPNAGKTSIFNALTGAHQHVGNYPGVTVERRAGAFLLEGERVRLVDLPGTYSLSSYSPEERIAEDELLSGGHDVVVLVVDSGALKRALVLLVHVMQIGARVVLCLNMSDEARAAGQKLDLELMEELLGVPVVETVGHRGEGLDGLKDAMSRARAADPSGQRLVLGERLDRAIDAVSAHLDEEAAPAAAHSWVATRLLVGDESIVGRLSNGDGDHPAVLEAARQRRRLEKETGLDISLFVTQRAFGFVAGLVREVMTEPARANARELSDRVDSVLVHRFLGLPIFALVMYAVFWVTFTAGEIPMGWIETGFEALGNWIAGFWPVGADSALRSLLVDGLVGGVGGVIVFVPNILLLFLGLALLEDTGYMARAAFLMDRLMHRFGLHGKSFLPMMTGFGCSIPGIMATRTLENERDRLTTMLVLPLMSCGARLPIWLLLIPAFFAPVWRAPMLFIIYLVGILLALVLALALRRSILKGEEAPFVMELPPYRMPTLRGLVIKMSERGWLYLRKAGTVILALSILMWAAITYPKPDSYQVDADIAAGRVQVVQTVANDAVASGAPSAAGVTVISESELSTRRSAEDMHNSLAGRLGRGMAPVIAPLGFDWKIGAGLVGALAAKEVFVAQMGIVYSLGETDEESRELRDVLGGDYPPLVGLSLMLFLLISAPCIATVALTRRESGSWKWAGLQFGGLTVIAYLAALVVFQLGTLLGLG